MEITQEYKHIKCSKCNHEWLSRSKLIYRTCPSCRKLIRVEEVLEPTETTEVVGTIVGAEETSNEPKTE